MNGYSRYFWFCTGYPGLLSSLIIFWSAVQEILLARPIGNNWISAESLRKLNKIAKKRLESMRPFVFCVKIACHSSVTLVDLNSQFSPRSVLHSITSFVARASCTVLRLHAVRSTKYATDSMLVAEMVSTAVNTCAQGLGVSLSKCFSIQTRKCRWSCTTFTQSEQQRCEQPP